MKYCPHCRRPTARVSGPCPHCGKDLSGAAEPPSVKPLSRETDPSDEALNIQDAYVPRTPGSASGLDLELSVIDEDLIADRVRPQALSLHTSQSLSGFGKVEPGIIGAIRYWLRVKKRLSELKKEHAFAEDQKRAALEKRTALEVELGRKILRLKVISSAMAPLIQSAMAIERDLKTREAGRSFHLLEHKKQLESLEEQIRQIELSASSHREQEAKLQEGKKALEHQKRGFETTKKRHQIDLQNTEALLAQKRTSQNPDGQDKMKLAADIIALESKRQSLTNQLSSLESSLSDLTAPLADFDAKLAAIRMEIKPFDDRCAALRTEIESFRGSFAESDSKEVDAIQKDAEQVQSAWAEAGRQALKERFSHPELTSQQSATIAATKEAYDAVAAAERLSQAQSDYDKRAVRTGQIAVFGTAATVIIIAIIVFSVI